MQTTLAFLARLVVSRLDRLKSEYTNYACRYCRRFTTTYISAFKPTKLQSVRRASRFRTPKVYTNLLKNPPTVTTFNMRLYSDYWAAFGRQSQKKGRSK